MSTSWSQSIAIVEAWSVCRQAVSDARADFPSCGFRPSW